MFQVLLTAFEPYGQIPHNSSHACWELLTEFPANLSVTRRVYPVDFEHVRVLLREEWHARFDLVLHLGQAPGSAAIRLEAIGLNLQGGPGAQDFPALEPEGPAAYRSQAPWQRWAKLLRDHGHPAEISFHAGTYLCNAALYWSCHLAATKHAASAGPRPQVLFVHLPLLPTQAASREPAPPSMSAEQTAAAIRLLLEDFAQAIR